MWTSKDKSWGVFKLERTRCPVCRATLGERNCNTIFIAHCEECRATFTWQPEEDRPTVKMDRDIPNRCCCSNCKS